LASNTKKKEGKIMSSLRVFFFNLVVIVIFFFTVFTSGVTVPCPWVFHSWRRKRGIDDGLGVSKPIDACISR
jgi:hypothetical protein